jgi:hypothetical protein
VLALALEVMKVNPKPLRQKGIKSEYPSPLTTDMDRLFLGLD